VMFAPATGFFSEESRSQGLNAVRISYCLNVQDLEKSVECLREALKVYPGRTI